MSKKEKILFWICFWILFSIFFIDSFILYLNSEIKNDLFFIAYRCVCLLSFFGIEYSLRWVAND